MKTKWNQSGRHHCLCRRSPGSTLLRPLILFSLLLTSLPACLISSCNIWKEPLQENETVNVAVDSCWFELFCSVHSEIADTAPPVQHLDVLVYDADGVSGLESWNRYDAIPDTIRIKGAKRLKTIVAIANSPRSFNRRAIERYDSIELLSYEFDEDSPEVPLMSGICSLSPDAPGHIRLEPLLARVQLCEVSNTMRKYVRLEDPRIYLENMNASAEILRSSGFRPTEVLEGQRKVSLPYDIGIYSQHPLTELFCYPNDSDAASMGTPRTSLVFECEIQGQTCRFPIPLESVARNKTLHVDITVNAPDLYDSKVY